MVREKNTLKAGDKVWACAYDYNYNRMEKALIQKPVYGQIVVNTKGWSKLGFAVMKADGTPRTSGIVSLEARTFTDTEKECVEEYNKKIRNRMYKLTQELEQLKKDIIYSFDS